jgi:hypothetical protein
VDKESILNRIMKIYFSFIIFFLSASYSCRSQENIYDDFESSRLNAIWSTGRMELRSFEIQSAIVRRGNNASKITLRTGDVVEAGNDSSLASERDELEEAKYLNSVEDKKYQYEFSLFLPADFPIVPTRLIIAQWKQRCPRNSCSDDSPILAIRYQSGKLMITLNNDSGRHRLYELKEEARNRWLDFRFLIRFSKDSGEITTFLNEQNIVNYKGVTSYSIKRGYDPGNNHYYFKMGLYRDRMPEPMVIYIDEYRKREIKIQQ